MEYFQYDFCKESSKINTSHMAHIKKCLFFNVFSIYGVRKMAYFRCAWSGHIISKKLIYPVKRNRQ